MSLSRAIAATLQAANSEMPWLDLDPEWILDGVRFFPTSISVVVILRNEHGMEMREADGGLTCAAYEIPQKSDWYRNSFQELVRVLWAEEPELEGQALVGGIEIRNHHAYFTPESGGQWHSNATTYDLVAEYKKLVG